MARALLRWTQKYLGTRAAIARRTIGSFESGARTVRLRTRLDITRTLEDAGVVFDEKGGARLAGLALVNDGRVSRNADPALTPTAETVRRG